MVGLATFEVKPLGILDQAYVKFPFPPDALAESWVLPPTQKSLLLVDAEAVMALASTNTVTVAEDVQPFAALAVTV